MSGLRAAFAEFSDDGSDDISAAQLIKILTRPGEMQMTEVEANEIIARFDVNGDGRLSLDEFVAAWSLLDDDADDDALLSAIKDHRRGESPMLGTKGAAPTFASVSAILDALAKPEATRQWSSDELAAALDKLNLARTRLTSSLQNRAL